VSSGVLLVGLGRRGRSWNAVVGAHRGSHAAGVVDPDPTARAAAEAAGLPVWERLDDALGAAQADFAIVATPPELHVPQALACLGAGLGVLVEKPLAFTLDDAVAVADAADSAGLPALVGHNFRHRPLERTIRAALDAGAIGELRFAAAVSARPPRALPFDHSPLWDRGVHHVDLLRQRFGGTPDIVEAQCTSSTDGVSYSLHLGWKGGGGAAEYALREGGRVYHHAEWLEGPDSALRITDGQVSLITTTRRPRRLRVRRGPAAETVLLDALLRRDASALGAREALGTIATLEAAVRSIAAKRPAEVVP
jgi:predicted dehydrogenase